MERLRRVAVLGLWVAGLGVAVLLLTWSGGGRLGTPPVAHPDTWSAWLAARTAPEVTFVILRLLTTAVGWYLVTVTVVGMAARAARSGRLVRGVDAVTLPILRRALQASLGLTLATASVGVTVAPSPVLAAWRGTPPVHVTEPADPEAEPDRPEVPEEQQASPGPVAPADPVWQGAEPADRSTGSTWTVEPGDHLWSIAARTVAARRGRPAPTAQVAVYWRRLIRENRDRLVDPDDPDLILPGQRLRLPAGR